MDETCKYEMKIMLDLLLKGWIQTTAVVKKKAVVKTTDHGVSWSIQKHIWRVLF